MRTTVAVLVCLAALDLLGCGVLLGVVFVIHRRQRRAARQAGEPVPPTATGQFAALAVLGAVGLVGLYLSAVILLDG